jgi:hypothetical protein
VFSSYFAPDFQMRIVNQKCWVMQLKQLLGRKNEKFCFSKTRQTNRLVQKWATETVGCCFVV